MKQTGWTMDRIVPLAALALLTVLFCMTRYADYDLWWHLKLGESVVMDWRIPWHDTFSYTAHGREQFTGEWLADALIFLTFKTCGFLGINLLKAALLSLALYFTWLQIRRTGKNGYESYVTAVITLLLVLFAIRFRLFVRPYLFSLPLLAATLYLLARWRDGATGRYIYALPLLVLFWANLSVGVVFGIFAIGLATILEGVCKKSWRLLPVLLLSLLASLANPETYRLYALAIDLTSDPYRTLIGEYQPMTIDILVGSGLRYTLCFQILAVGALLHLLIFRGWKNYFQLLLFSFLLYESFRQIRLIELFSLVAAPSFALFLSRMLALVPEKIRRFTPVGNYGIAVLILVLIPVSVLNSPIYAFGIGPKEGAFPEGALKFLEREHISGKMFNSYGFGGYIIWRGGGRQVFIDGRYRRLYTPREYGEYKGILESAADWKSAEQKYGFDHAVLEYDLLSRRFPAHLPANPQWALVYWDNHSLVYVKRTPERAQLIATHEYRIARPTFLDLSYLDEYQQPGRVNDILPLLDREVALNPDNQFVVLARVSLRHELGRFYLKQNRDDLERVVATKPDFAMKHTALGMIMLEQGDLGRAKQEFVKSLRLDPLDATTIQIAKKMGIKVKIPKSALAGHP